MGHASPLITRRHDHGRGNLDRSPATCAAAAATPSPSHPWRHAYIPGPIALTAAEIRRLFNGLVTGPLRDRLPGPARAISEIQHWTNWRRHYHGQAAKATTSADSPLNSTHNELTLPY